MQTHISLVKELEHTIGSFDAQEEPLKSSPA